MRKIIKSIDIDASVDRVFDYLTHPENFLAIWPSMVEIKNVERRDDGWHSFDWTYRMAGMRFHGHAKTVRVEKNAYIELKNETGIPSVFRYTYKPHGKGVMRLTEEVEYTIPTPLLGRLAEAAIAKMNEHELDLVLKNLKAAVETALQPKANAGAHAHA